MTAKVYAIQAPKGGASKTTTALALAEGLKMKGKRVLLIDMDQQRNASNQYDVVIDNHVTVYDLLTDTDVDAEEGVQSMESSDIIAGDALLTNAETEMATLLCKEAMLTDAIEPLKPLYDFIVIDCPPSLGVVTTNALVAADEVIMPIIPDGYSIEDFDRFVQLLDRIRSNKRLNPNLKIGGILLTQYERNQRLSKDFARMLDGFAQEYETKAYKTKIRRCCKTREAQFHRQSLFEYAPKCTTAEDYLAFVEEILSEVKNDG